MKQCNVKGCNWMGNHVILMGRDSWGFPQKIHLCDEHFNEYLKDDVKNSELKK